MGGAKIFVRPGHFEASLEAIRLANLSLFPNHVIVDPENESTVIGLVRQLRGREAVHPTGTSVLPLAFAEVTAQMEQPINVSRTFIHINIPSSLRSESQPGSPRTMSTTDANPRTCGRH